MGKIMLASKQNNHAVIEGIGQNCQCCFCVITRTSVRSCKVMLASKQNSDIIYWLLALSSTEHTPIVIQLCLVSRIGLWEKITTHHLISRTIFLPMWGLQILLFGLWDRLVQRQSTECNYARIMRLYVTKCWYCFYVMAENSGPEF